MSFTALFSPHILLYMGYNAQVVKNLQLDISLGVLSSKKNHWCQKFQQKHTVENKCKLTVTK